jgi:fructosamine-3-kinase
LGLRPSKPPLSKYLHFIEAKFMMQQNELIQAALRMAGDTTPLASYELVSGGMISQAARIRSGSGEYLLKWGGRGLANFFTVEARGLELLASSGALRVPAVLAYQDTASAERGALSDAPGDTEPSSFGAQGSAFILLEWLDTPPHADREAAFEALGHQLAALHRVAAPAYGHDHDNYLGIMPQANGWMTSWIEFFRERRLRVQGDLALRNGHLPGARAHRLELLLGRLESWLGGHTPPAALLHGDLWAGNVLIGPGGAPALIDPAVSYGDRESELAYTALFGGFPATFYRAYEAAWPLPPGWQERRDLYNLYHLINHLNHFGEQYGAHVDRVLRYYVG